MVAIIVGYVVVVILVNILVVYGVAVSESVIIIIRMRALYVFLMMQFRNKTLGICTFNTDCK